MNSENQNTVTDLITAHRDRPGALLPLLHDIQDAIGYIPSDAVPEIAQALNLSRAEVHGVISYYRHIQTVPPARNVIRLCRAEACQARGGEALATHVEAQVKGRDMSLEAVYCLGLCAIGPAMQINETTLHGKLTREKFDALIAELEAQS